MHRTQVYLDDAHYQALRARARREGKSMAALLRSILDVGLGLGGRRRRRDPFDAVVGGGRGDGSPVAENYEDYLYGSRR